MRRVRIVTAFAALVFCIATAPFCANGQGHSCAVSSGNAVSCWGKNSRGCLGDGSTVERSRPVSVVGLNSNVTVVMLALGHSHSCVLLSGGAVSCWGNNGFGQVGDGTDTDRYTPVSVVGLSSGVAMLASGYDHSCALSSGGGWSCWGYNINGQVGDGTTTHRYAPVSVQGLSSGVAMLALGGMHSCSLSSGGAVSCWGANSKGQVGDGTTVQRNTPTSVQGLSSGIEMLALGYSHSCALSSGGAVACWGANNDGQVGDRTTAQRNTPVSVQGLNSGIAMLALGYSHSCALSSGGAVSCWGTNSDGQVGDGSSFPQKREPYSVIGLSKNVTTIALGGIHSCALSSGGAVSCWGDNLFNSLGDGTSSDRNTPVFITSFAAKLLWEDTKFCNIPTLSAFEVASADRVSGKLYVSVTIVFTPSRSLLAGSAMTLSYPLNFFASSIIPSVALNASSVPGLSATCSATSATSVVITTFGAAIIAWSAVTVTIGGFTMGPPTTGSVNVKLQLSECSFSNAVSSGGIGFRVLSVAFNIVSSDRVVGKSSVPISLDFTPTTAIPSGGTITLNYPSNFFAPTVTPTVAAGASSVSGLVAMCSATSVTAVVISISGASISPSSAFSITITGFTIGISGANVADGITVQTSVDPDPSAGITSGPLTCPAGSSWTGQPSTCIPCLPGTYQDLANSDSCKPCDPGKYCASAGLTAASPCPVGTYNQNVASAALSSCTMCPAGTYSENVGATALSACLDCRAGSYCLAGCSSSNGSGICAAGTFSIAGNGTSSLCNPCPGGRYCLAGCASIEGSGVCAAGTFASAGSGTNSSCSACPGGRYCLAGCSISSGSGPCRPGSFSTSGSGTTAECSACPAGAYCLMGCSSPSGSGLCEPGSFSVAGSGMTASCSRCPAGKFCASSGLTSASGDCPSGSFSNGSAVSATCTACPVGFFNSFIGQQTCQSCPAGKYCSSPGLVMASGDCPVGSFSPGNAFNISCIPCLPGKHCISSGLALPSGACPAASYSTGGAKNESCTPCPPGTFSAGTGASACLLCASGFSAPEGSSLCQALEHAKIILKLTGSIDTFGEGSARRNLFLSGLAAVLQIPEKQIVIISVSEGSVIVDLCFVRVDGVHMSPTEIVVRLKSAATSGELEKFGLLDMTVGQNSVFESSIVPVDTGVVVGASVGASAFVILLVLLIWRWRLHRSGSNSKRRPSIIVSALPETFTDVQSTHLIPDPAVLTQSGSFGEVSKCVWSGTEVAVKRIFNLTDVHKFQQEARMMHSIQHPNCVRLYGVCSAPPQLVMEWMGGGDLAQFLQHRPQPKIHRRLSLFRQICAGLNSLHSHSPDPIIHSDLKPSNILLDSDRKIAKIADFGLSKMKTASYAGSNAVGTLLYFAPEMLLNEVSSHRPTDIYAMGLILWELLSGKPVWHSQDGSPLKPVQLISKYNRNERPSLDELPLGIDPAIIALMQDCWAEDPAQRPTADELWRRMSALDPNNPEHNKPLELYPDDFVPTCRTLEDCLRSAVPTEVFNGLVHDMTTISRKYHDIDAQIVVCLHNLSEVEAKCIIMFTHESPHVPDHPRPLDPRRPKRDNQLYFLFNKACRERDPVALQRFQNFSFHFTSALNKLPNFPLTDGQNLYRGFGQRLEEMNDMYRTGSVVWWHYTSSSTLHRETAYKSFAMKSGTLMEIAAANNAKDIRALSMIPSEGELLIPPNTEFKVQLALSSDQAQILNKNYATIPDNVDLVILETALPKLVPDTSESRLNLPGAISTHEQDNTQTLGQNVRNRVPQLYARPDVFGVAKGEQERL